MCAAKTHQHIRAHIRVSPRLAGAGTNTRTTNRRHKMSTSRSFVSTSFYLPAVMRMSLHCQNSSQVSHDSVPQKGRSTSIQSDLLGAHWPGQDGGLNSSYPGCLHLCPVSDHCLSDGNEVRDGGGCHGYATVHFSTWHIAHRYRRDMYQAWHLPTVASGHKPTVCTTHQGLD